MSRRIFEATHRAFIAIEIQVGTKLTHQDWINVRTELHNVGSDQALGVSVEFTSGIELFKHVVSVGDLQPSESRIYEANVPFGLALAKAWFEEIEQNFPLKFYYVRRFRTSAGLDMEERGNIIFDPTENVVQQIQRRTQRP